MGSVTDCARLVARSVTWVISLIGCEGVRMRFVVALVLGFVILVFSGCGGDEASDGELRCPGEQCVDCQEDGDCEAGLTCHDEGSVCVVTACESHGECPQGSYCGEEEICVEQACAPGEGRCEGASLSFCNAAGSGYGAAEECSTGVCEGGECQCDEAEHCGPGEVCGDAGACSCPTERCGEAGVCCPSGESCVTSEICDGDDCETFAQCRGACAGELCGFQGELCCEGETPICGPNGECAPSCEGAGELCGEDFDQCCGEGEVCIFGNCRTPGAPCEHFTECDFGEYCDQGLGQCMPDDFPDDLICEDDYDFGELEPEVAWHWEGIEYDEEVYQHVMMTPLVADMTGTGVPHVVVNAYPTGSSQSMPVIIDGASGETVYFNATHRTDFGSQLALVDITKSGVPEIVVIGAGSDALGVIRNIAECPVPEEDEDGCYLWWRTDDVNTQQGAPVVADLNADGNVEIVLNDRIYDGLTGDVLGVLPGEGYAYTIAVDVTGDGRMEILGAECLYSFDEDHEVEEIWCTDSSVAPPGKRYAAAGDVASADGREGLPEIVLTGDGNIYVIAAESGEVLHSFELPGGGDGGSPIIADFDGDGSAEFGVASALCYTVFDLDCVVPEGADPDEVLADRPGCVRPEIEQCEFERHCACEDLRDTYGTGDGVLWSIYVQDESSHRTGSSVFDFQGNGRNEVVYNDECLLMVLDGQDGSPYFVRGNTNRTSSEYPLVVDVTGDNRTNIVVAANNDQFSRDCEDPINERPERFPECHPEDEDGERPTWCDEGTTGVYALQDPDDRWVRTRAVWNQFDYYIDNATETGAVLTSPSMPWESHNTFRANRQGEVPLNAPDVVVSSLQVNPWQCPPAVEFRATIQNLGAAAIPAGLPVSLYMFSAGSQGTLVSTEIIDTPISPGGTRVVDFSFEVAMVHINQELDFQVVANDDGQGEAPMRDCNPDTASATVTDVVCRIQR